MILFNTLKFFVILLLTIGYIFISPIQLNASMCGIDKFNKAYLLCNKGECSKGFLVLRMPGVGCRPAAKTYELPEVHTQHPQHSIKHYMELMSIWGEYNFNGIYEITEFPDIDVLQISEQADPELLEEKKEFWVNVGANERWNNHLEELFASLKWILVFLLLSFFVVLSQMKIPEKFLKLSSMTVLMLSQILLIAYYIFGLHFGALFNAFIILQSVTIIFIAQIIFIVFYNRKKRFRLRE